MTNILQISYSTLRNLFIGFLSLIIWLPIFVNESAIRFDTFAFSGRALPLSLFLVPIFVVIGIRNRATISFFLIVMLVGLILLTQLTFSSLSYQIVSICSFLAVYQMFKRYPVEQKFLSRLTVLYTILFAYVSYRLLFEASVYTLHGEITASFVIYNYEQYFAYTVILLGIASTQRGNPLDRIFMFLVPIGFSFYTANMTATILSIVLLICLFFKPIIEPELKKLSSGSLHILVAIIIFIPFIFLIFY